MKTTKTSLLLKWILTGPVLATSIALTSGCFLVAVGAAGAAGAGAVAYVRGDLVATLGNNYDAVDTATSRAIGQLQFARIGESRDAFSAVITARTAEDKKIEIKLTRRADNLTRVDIRIGLFGDEEKSRMILDRIRANL